MSTSTETIFGGEPATFSGNKMPFRDSATATKQPKAGFGKLPNGFESNAPASLLDKLKAKLSRKETLETRIANDDAARDAERERVRQLANELRRLETIVERAEEALTIADGRLAELKAERAAIVTGARPLWGMPEIWRPIWHAYETLQPIDAAIADYPEVRKTLVGAVAKEKAALAKFERENELGDLD